MSEIYPVIHVQDPEQTRQQAEIASSLYADGVFLIEPYGDTNLLLAAYDSVRSSLPLNSYVGLNFLETGPVNAIDALIEATTGSNSMRQRPNGLWIDDLFGQNDYYEDAIDELEEMHAMIDSFGLESVSILGGVAFKQSEHYTDDPEIAAQQARYFGSYVDVVVSSGEKTGDPIELQKLDAIREAVDLYHEDTKVGVASGVAIDNIDQMMLADTLLVSSSVETYPGSGEFDEQRLGQLIIAAHSL